MESSGVQRRKKEEGESLAESSLIRGDKARPFIKWVGGKGQLLPQLLRRVPSSYGRYFEPFIGGGALFFGLTPKVGEISDINEELINAYRVVRDSVEELIARLKEHRYDEDHFYAVRDWDRSPEYQKLPMVARAARFIYLNKTCFNGLHRVNSKGHFNVPFGAYKNPTIVDSDNLRLCSAALRGIDIEVASYAAVEHKASKGDLVYFDPPYAPLSATSNFTSYTKNGFDRTDQEALRDLCVRLDKKGVMVMLSNSSANHRLPHRGAGDSQNRRFPPHPSGTGSAEDRAVAAARVLRRYSTR